ncbi:MAG: UDP-glucose/GDP-mannose dehydrogenase family protein [Sphingopyxis sp.]
MKIVVVGVGYVGLVSGVCFADFGHTVACVDKDEGKIAGLKAGIIPIYEPGLSELVLASIESGRLSFSTKLADNIRGTTAIFIAVGTPARADNGHADLQFVFAAAKEIAENLTGPAVIVTKSTVPVGTGDKIEAIIRGVRPELEISVVSNPEFLREGSAIRDFQLPDRVVVGANDARGRDVLGAIYKPIHSDDEPVVYTDRRTAELIKYASNAFLATKIGFINEIANLCEAIGANVQDVTRGMGLDKRIGPKYLDAGPGYGGSCFPKDTLALVKAAESVAVDMSIVNAVVRSNDNRKAQMGERVVTELGNNGPMQIAILGLTFKPNTDDMRESPSIDIIRALQDAGHQIVAYDPTGTKEPEKIFSGITYAPDAYTACEGADAVVVVTEWGVFRTLDLTRVKAIMKGRLLFDMRNLYDHETVLASGLTYHSIGRPRNRPATIVE